MTVSHLISIQIYKTGLTVYVFLCGTPWECLTLRKGDSLFLEGTLLAQNLTATRESLNSNPRTP